MFYLILFLKRKLWIEETLRLIPNEKKLVPDEEKLVPDEEKLVPDEEKLVPDEEKLVPDEEKLVLDEEKLTPKEKFRSFIPSEPFGIPFFSESKLIYFELFSIFWFDKDK